MHILMISDVFFPRIKGVSTFIATFAEEFVRQEYSVHLIALCYDQSEINEDWIFRIPSRKILFDPDNRMMSSKAIKKTVIRIAL